MVKISDIHFNPTIKCISIITEYNTEISIFNMSGQLIFHEENYNSGNKIKLSTFPNGDYLITINTLGRLVVKLLNLDK